MTLITRRIVILTALAALVILVGAFHLQAAEKVTCPVSGKEIEKSEAKGSFEYKGTTYYFCCENCKEAFVKDPEKYIANPGSGHGEAGHEGHMHAAEEENGTAVDPVCNMKVDKAKAKYKAEHNGKTYYFCSEGCKEKFVKDPAAYIGAEDETVTCPVKGETFNKSDANGSMEYKGKTYYFCCAGCQDKFKADPEKYAKKDGANGGENPTACACSDPKSTKK